MLFIKESYELSAEDIKYAYYIAFESEDAFRKILREEAYDWYNEDPESLSKETMLDIFSENYDDGFDVYMKFYSKENAPENDGSYVITVDEFYRMLVAEVQEYIDEDEEAGREEYTPEEDEMYDDEEEYDLL